MQANEAITMLNDAVKESIARAKSSNDFDRANKFQQLQDDINEGKVSITYHDPAEGKGTGNDSPGD